ncbi:response regulator [Photobacterium kishitanii]|uniref:response regulator n=1 Tax=Photobacterium kishitanii TaxID=318456 RepID=UPI0004311D0E|nr:response regulator [Photobacterium kishitanii]CEO38423.1 Response regulator [Photobacterium kishitanii]
MRRTQSVLIVDDSSIIQQTTKLILVNGQFQSANIFCASNASEAIKYCQQQDFDILFLDFNLGFGSTGLQLLERLHHNGLLQHSPLIFILTADDSPAVLMGFSEYQPDDYLVKPLRLNTLKQRLEYSFEQRVINDHAFERYLHSGISGIKAICTKSSSPQSTHSTMITAVAKRLFNQKKPHLDADIEALLTLIQYQEQSLPAQLLLAKLWLRQQKFQALEPLLVKLRRLYPDHLMLLEYSACLALLQNKITQGYDFWLQAHNVSKNNLHRLFGLLWIECHFHNHSAMQQHLREAISYLRHSVWDKPCYHAFIIWLQLQHSDKKSLPIERLWRTISQQKTITKNERPFIYLLQAWQYLDSDNTLNAYKSYIAALDMIQQTSPEHHSFEFDAIALCISNRLAMTRHQITCYQRLQHNLNQHSNEPHSIIKNMWLETMQPTSSNQDDEKYRYALRLVKQKYYIEAGQAILQLWPHYRFDEVLARCLVELSSRGYVDGDPQHQLWIKEARWTFESQDFKPDWYLKLKAQYRSLQRPLY